MSEFLFPRRLTRRDFLAASGATAAGLALAGTALGADEKPVTIGTGKWTYTLDPKWGTLPEGMKYGLGCAIVVDSKDRIIVTSRSENPCVAIFDRDGKLLETWNKDFVEKVGMKPGQVTATAHGLYLSQEKGGEFLYWTENVATPKDSPKIGARIYKTDMQGKILYTLGNVEKEGSTSQKFDFTNPTDVAVAPNGDIYVVDGYGSQRVALFDKDWKHKKTIGKRGKEHGEFNTCHGVWVSTIKKEPEVYIADRANNRLEVYSLDLEYKRTVPDMRQPCCFYQHDGHLYIPELGARVTIIDGDDKVVARLGDGAGMKQEDVPKSPEKFFTPHAMCVDSKGDFYVLEWIDFGRPRRFKHTPA